MISIYNKQIKHIPCLVIELNENHMRPLPLVIYIHGFTSAKEDSLTFAYLLAKEGYRVVLPDSKHHGERIENISQEQREGLFWDIVIQNIKELDHLKTYFKDKNCILNNRVGVAGTSMGGITAASALTQYEWIKSVAVLMGSPKMTAYAKELIANHPGTADLHSEKEVDRLIEKLKTYDLSKNISKLAERPLLLWHAEDDDVVPVNHTKEFYEQIKDCYDIKNNLQLLIEAKQGHKISRYAILETVKFFINTL